MLSHVTSFYWRLLAETVNLVRNGACTNGNMMSEKTFRYLKYRMKPIDITMLIKTENVSVTNFLENSLFQSVAVIKIFVPNCFMKLNTS